MKTWAFYLTGEILSFPLVLPLFLLLHMMGWKRSVLAKNLRACLPLQRRFFLSGFYFHLARCFCQFLWGRALPIQVRPVDLPKMHHLQQTGGILATAHFYNWEALGIYLHQKGFPLKTMASPLKKAFWNDFLKRKRRIKGPAILDPPKMENALDFLEKKGVIGLLLDQHRSSDHLSLFFGNRVQTNPLPLHLLRKSRLPSYFFVLLPNNSLRIVPLTREGAPFDLQKFYARYHKLLELVSSRHPNYWFGMAHRRFKGSVTY